MTDAGDHGPDEDAAAPGAGITIRRLRDGELDLVEPLWSALREHHGSVVPEWGDPRPRDESWALRRAAYEEWLADPRTFGLLAFDPAGTLLGYSMVRIIAPSSTWQFDERGEIETLSVAPQARGQGIGGALIEAVRTELRAAGITLLGLQAVARNADAIRFYERHGLHPAIVTLHGEV